MADLILYDERLLRVTARPSLSIAFDRFDPWFARNRQAISRYPHPSARGGDAPGDCTLAGVSKPAGTRKLTGTPS